MDRKNRWLLVAIVLSSIVRAEVGPNPSQVTIRSISHGGNGCPQNSVGQMLSPDAKSFSLLFDEYIAEAGPGVAFAQNRKSCQIAVDLRFPSGWSYTLFTVDYRGYGRLESGTSGLQQTSYFFQGSSQNATLRSTFNGPMDRDYQFRDRLGLDSTVWSPCGATRPVVLNTQIRVNASGNRRALLTVDSISGELEHVYGIQWRRCN